jgi:hypothetical protein
METINNLLNIINGAQSNPLLFTAIIFALVSVSVFGKYFYDRLMKAIRHKEAEANRIQDRQRDLNQIEEAHSRAIIQLRDRLRKIVDEKKS